MQVSDSTVQSNFGNGGQRKVALVGVPMDLGGGRRGVDMGPSAFRIAGVERAVKKLGLELIDRGNVEVMQPHDRAPKDPKARYLEEIADCCTRLKSRVQEIVGDEMLPLVVGGDHSIAVGTVAGISSHYHAQGKRIGLIWFDAHGDVNTPETTHSGNIHGMPLASILGHGPDALTRIGERFPMVDVENATLVGVRSLDEGERELIRSLGLTCFTMKDIDQLGIHEVMQRAIKRAMAGTAGFHLSFDLDGTDPSVAPGVGTPVPGGVSYRESHTVMELVADSGGMLGLEMTEINPILDDKNQTSRAAVEFVASALGKRVL
ncbi:MAG: arginase [Planctomycetota bacterium]|jgi:arginase